MKTNLIRYGILLIGASVLTSAALCLTACSDNEELPGGDDPVAVTGIALDKHTLTLSPGQIEILVARVTPAEATDKRVYWSAENTRITVDQQGRVTGIAEGSSAILVTTCDGAFTDRCEVNVVPAEVTGITLDQERLELPVGQSRTLGATVLPENATIRGVGWSSNNERIATVDAQGTVTALAVGEAVVTASTLEGGKQAECRVRVREAYSIYAVGLESQGNPHPYYAAVWRDGELLYRLNEQSQWSAFADAVFVTDAGDVYVTGYETQIVGVNVAYVWKNGEVLHTLTDGTRLGFAPGLWVEGTDVYAAGYDNVMYGNSVGYVWKNGEELYRFGDNSSLVVCNDVCVADGIVYAAGYEYLPGEPDHRIAKYWKDGVEVALNGDGTWQAEATGIVVRNGEVFVTGKMVDPATRAETACVWKSGEAVFLPGGVTSYKTDFDSQGNAYTVGWGYVDGDLRGMVWKNFTEAVPYPTDGKSGFNDVMTHGTDVLVGGHEDVALNTNRGKVWSNGVPLYAMQLSEGMVYSAVHGIYVK